MSPKDDWRELAVESFPRVSGDEPTDPDKQITPETFSPRERG